MLPAYLTFVVSGAEHRPTRAVGRAAMVTVAMTAGFVAVFAVFGLLAVSIAVDVQRYLPAVTVVVGVALVVAGICLLAAAGTGRSGSRALREGARPTRLGSMFGYGVAYAVASLSCTVGPFLAVTATAREAARRRSHRGLWRLCCGIRAGGRDAGRCSRVQSAALSTRLRNAMPVINRIGGALVILVGLYVAYYGIYELRLFHGDGPPDDTVISAAGRLQSAVADWVNGHGGWPWVLALAVLSAVAVVWAWRRRACRR